MATTREVRRGERLLRLHQLVLLCSHRDIRSGIGYVELASEQQRSDFRGHEHGHELELWRMPVDASSQDSLSRSCTLASPSAA